MIDTHCHLTYQGLIEQIDDVISAARDSGVDRMICVGTTPEDVRKAIELAERYDNVFATVGIHPHYTDVHHNVSAIAEMVRDLAPHPKVVALGEMGIDKHYPDPPLEMQKKVFAAQLDLAKRIDLPIIIHNREATRETLDMIQESGLPGDRFVFHCFTGKRDELDAILAIGAMVSFTGITTFRNANEIAECAAAMPSDRIMLETDSPYLAPEPHRRVKPNEPRYAIDVAKFIAAKRGEEFKAFVATCDANAERFFRLKK